MLDLPLVPMLPSDTDIKKLGPALVKEGLAGDACEGFVVRRRGEFQYADFRKAVAKYVRANHVQTHGHWMRSQIVPNGTRS